MICRMHGCLLCLVSQELNGVAVRTREPSAPIAASPPHLDTMRCVHLFVVCMFVCYLYVCYACRKYVCMVRMFVFVFVCMYAWFVCLCLYVCMYV